MKKENKNIIINGRRLNKIQRYLFNKSSAFIYMALTIPIILVMTAIAVFSFTITKGQVEIVVALVIVEILAMAFFPYLMDSKVFMDKGLKDEVKRSEIEHILRDSYIINKEVVKKLLKKPWYNKMDPRLNFLKNSSGHEIFEEYKEVAYQDNATMINYMRAPSVKMIKDHIILIAEHGARYPFVEPFTFKYLSKGDLRDIYAWINQISPTDKFANRAIMYKPDTEIYQELDRKLVSDTVQY